MLLSSISSTTLFGTNKRLFADSLPPSNFMLSSTLLPLSSGSFTHNSAGVPIVATRTKADMIDDDNDMVAGSSGMGSMVKGKGGEWKEQMGLCESFERSA